jgi:hypothetical protein
VDPDSLRAMNQVANGIKLSRNILDKSKPHNRRVPVRGIELQDVQIQDDMQIVNTKHLVEQRKRLREEAANKKRMREEKSDNIKTRKKQKSTSVIFRNDKISNLQEKFQDVPQDQFKLLLRRVGRYLTGSKPGVYTLEWASKLIQNQIDKKRIKAAPNIAEEEWREDE